MIRFPFGKNRRGGEEEEAGAVGPHEEPQEDAQDLDPEADARDDDAPSGPRFGDAVLASEGMGSGAEALNRPAAPEEGEEAEGPTVDAFGAPIDRISMDEQERMVEAMLFASDQPLSTAELASRMPIGCDAAVAVRRLEERYKGRGVALVRVAGKWAFRTAPDLAHLLVGESVEQRKLSRAAIETLAIIAYHQPVTRAEIEEIRQVGVSKGTIDLLMELEWIKLGRRRQTPGRPVTFVTTDKFLVHFGFETLRDLPRLEELRQAGLLDNRPPVGFAPTPGEGAEALEEMGDDEDADDDQDLLV